MTGAQLNHLSPSEAGLYYRSLGWNAVAFCSHDHQGVGVSHRQVCKSPGKVPLSAWKSWQTEFVQEWRYQLDFRNHPNANVGVILGPVSGLVAVDGDGPEAGRLLRALTEQTPALKEQTAAPLWFRTQRGFRLLYRIPADRIVKNRLAASDGEGNRLEILGQGRTTVMPPSRHPVQGAYKWPDGNLPEPALSPSWLTNPRPDSLGREFDLSAPCITTFRNERLFRLACAMRRWGCLESELLTALLSVNHRCTPPLELSELRNIAHSAARYKPHGAE